MIAFKVSKNGEVISLAGDTEATVLGVYVNGTGDLGADSPVVDQESTRLHLSVRGVRGRHDPENPMRHLKWASLEDLDIGDRLMIEVTSVAEADAPSPGAGKPMKVRKDDWQRAKDLYIAYKEIFEASDAPKEAPPRHVI